MGRGCCRGGGREGGCVLRLSRGYVRRGAGWLEFLRVVVGVGDVKGVGSEAQRALNARVGDGYFDIDSWKEFEEVEAFC